MTMTVETVDLADGVYAGEPPSPAMVRVTIGAIIASAIPVRPPRDWFRDPQLGELTPLTIQADGRVFGHIAGWKTDHIGLNGRVRAPHSRSNYAFFATGVLECDNGEMVNVGQITLTGGHAPLEASVAEAVAHYDNTDSGLIDVAVGEDRYGIWAAGSLRPEVDELKLRRLRASGVSGDWRPINGSLELVAVCSVNVPGFPVPRARVAAGQPMALIAAGTTEIVEVLIADHANASDRATTAAALTALDERMRMVENALLDRIIDRRDAIVAALDTTVVTVPDTDVDALRARVHRVSDDLHAEEALNESVLTDPILDPPLVESVVEEVVETEPLPPTDLEALRARVRGVNVADPVDTPAPDQPEVVEDEPDIVEEDETPVEAVPDAVAADGKWEDGMPFEFTFAECQHDAAHSLQASLRARVKGDALVAAPKEWSAEARRKAKGKGQTMPDGSYPTSTKADWYRARQSIGRAKNPASVKRYLKKRAKTLGIPKKDYENL
ncbi:MAG TPA: hypothetical protein VIQ02_16615 [Jiangellaceae bacterium]